MLAHVRPFTSHARPAHRFGRWRVGCVRLFISVAAFPALLMAAGTARAELILSLQQVGPPPLAVSGTQTRVDMLLKLTGSSAAPINTSGFSAILSWTGSSNLYTVNLTTGTALIGPPAMTPTGTNYLWNGLGANSTMNVLGGLDPTYQRFVSVDSGTDGTVGPGPFEVVLAKIGFAVAAGQTGQFDFTVNAAAPTYGLIDSGDDFNTITMANGGGQLVVVPEPSTVTALAVGGGVMFGVHALRRRRASSLNRLPAAPLPARTI